MDIVAIGAAQIIIIIPVTIIAMVYILTFHKITKISIFIFGLFLI